MTLTGASASFLSSCENSSPTLAYPLSLAQWSLHRALKGGQLDNLDFPSYTKEKFDVTAVEWVNQFFYEEKPNLGFQPKAESYLTEMKQRCDDAGVKSLLIMCDRVGNLGNPDAAKRKNAVEGHYAWCEAAKLLGCHSIRVNAASDKELSPEEQADLCADGLAKLCEFAKTLALNVIVENHGGMSSNGAWLASVMKQVNLPNCGTLPDFGNFYILKRRTEDPAEWDRQKTPLLVDPAYFDDGAGVTYDRYVGTRELMPYAKGVSAKAHDFDEAGNELYTDFGKMNDIVQASGYQGHIGIEYEGKILGEDEGILATKALLERTFVKSL